MSHPSSYSMGLRVEIPFDLEGSLDQTRSKTDSGVSHMSQVRVTFTKPQKFDILSLINALSTFGEIQLLDMSTHQLDACVSVSYFDSRAAQNARNLLVSSPVPGMSLCCADLDVPFCSTAFARCVDVVGFAGSDPNCEEFVFSVFERFGEIDQIQLQSNGGYRVVFFDSRSPLAVSALVPSSHVGSSPIHVSSDQVITLLLAGSSQAPLPAPTSPNTPNRLSSEFAINLREIDNKSDIRTTVMVRNIPKTFSQDLLVDILNTKFPNTFDFLYLPLDLMNGTNVGYSFINFKDPSTIVKVFNFLNNKNWKLVLSVMLPNLHVGDEGFKVCKVTYGRIQGLENLMEHFKSSSIMNQPDSIRPYFVTPATDQ